MSGQGIPLLLACQLLLVVLLVNCAHAQKGDRFKACKRNQPPAKLNECVKDALQKAFPELVKGLPNLGLATIDPLRVESLTVPKGKGAVSVDITFKNLDILGLHNVKIKSVDIDVDKFLMKVKLEIDGAITLQGDYTVDGKVLVLPLQGSGKCNITIVNPKGEITELQAKPITKKGKQYAQVTSLKFITTQTDRVYFDLENLFNGNKELGDNMNLVLNDNWKVVHEDIKGPVELALGEAFKTVADRVVQSVPYDSIFPK